MKINHPQKEIATRIVETLKANNFIALFAGGCVRDALLGREPKDYDVATEAFPEQVEALFPRTLPLGKAFGVIAVIDNHETIEVATFREEEGTIDGRRPETIQFCAAEEDAQRRDFTINGMFYDPIEQKLIDYVGGQADLEKKIIRAIGDPLARFEEDHLRMLRAIRFAHNLQFSIDPPTEAAIQKMAPLIKRISSERIEAEISRLLCDSPKPGDALAHLHKLGLLEHIIPEIIPMIGQQQPPQFHPEGDVFEHTVLMLNLMPQLIETVRESKPKATEEPSLPFTPRELAYTLLLHDIGKPATASIGPGTDGNPRIRFDGHAAVGARMAEKILARLKFPKKELQHIVDAIHGHMRFMDVQQMRKSTLRKLVGADTFDLEMALHWADCMGSHALLDNYEYLQSYVEEMANEPILPDPWVTGRDLIANGIQPGKQMGAILSEAYDAQIEGRFSTREEQLDWIIKTHAPAD